MNNKNSLFINYYITFALIFIIRADSSIKTREQGSILELDTLINANLPSGVVNDDFDKDYDECFDFLSAALVNLVDVARNIVKKEFARIGSSTLTFTLNIINTIACFKDPPEYDKTRVKPDNKVTNNAKVICALKAMRQLRHATNPQPSSHSKHEYGYDMIDITLLTRALESMRLC